MSLRIVVWFDAVSFLCFGSACYGRCCIAVLVCLVLFGGALWCDWFVLLVLVLLVAWLACFVVLLHVMFCVASL